MLISMHLKDSTVGEANAFFVDRYHSKDNRWGFNQHQYEFLNISFRHGDSYELLASYIQRLSISPQNCEEVEIHTEEDTALFSLC